MRRWGAAPLVLLAALAIAAPAGAATRKQVQAAAFDVPMPSAPVRDLVIERPTGAHARAMASASLARFPVNDGAGNTVDVSKTLTCAAVCTDADEPTIAAFLGTIAHGSEINMLSVLLVAPSEIAVQCGSPQAQACYYPSFKRMVINGNDTTASDGATREFVIAHEYGHHLANHRNNPPFDTPAIDWGPKRWASYERVCQGVTAGTYYPGNEGSHYFENPGEAFAEAFAFARFPTAPVPWHWITSLQPDTNSLVAARDDALNPWTGTSNVKRQGRFPKRKRPRSKQKLFPTALDGDMTLRLNGPAKPDYQLTLKGPDGKVLERSDGVGSREAVSYRLCGEANLSGAVRRHGRRLTRFFLSAELP